MHHTDPTPIHTLVIKMASCSERQFEVDYYGTCRLQEGIYMRSRQEETGESVRDILRQLESLREEDERQAWDDYKAECAESQEEAASPKQEIVELIRTYVHVNMCALMNEELEGRLSAEDAERLLALPESTWEAGAPLEQELYDYLTSSSIDQAILLATESMSVADVEAALHPQQPLIVYIVNGLCVILEHSLLQ